MILFIYVLGSSITACAVGSLTTQAFGALTFGFLLLILGFFLALAGKDNL